MIHRRYITTLILATLSVAAMALTTNDEPNFPGLDTNPRYLELKRQNSLLLEREDSVQHIIASAREQFSISRDTLTAENFDMEGFSTYILALEEEIFEIRQQRGDVITELNNMEQTYIIEHMYARTNTELNYAENSFTDNSIEEAGSIEVTPSRGVRNLIENDIIRNTLNKEDYEELCAAEELDRGLPVLADAYMTTYRHLRTTASEYTTTQSEATADSLFVIYGTLRNDIDSLDAQIASQWHRVIDAKYYAYGYILEVNHRYDLLDSSSADFSEMQQRSAREDGFYASDGLAHYAMGYPTLLDFEIDFSREMGLEEAADSLQGVRNSMQLPDYRLDDIRLERRLFLDYQPIVIGRTNYYSTTNPVPELKVYERGLMYRILLGTFRSKQPMTLFKGVQPLYIAQNEDDSYSYYAGGFSSPQEANEALLFLKEKGFKRPEICRWYDGVMVNITAEESDEQKEEVTAPVGNRYIVMIECETLSDEMRETINNTSPDKMISRRGAKFAIGTFSERSEADMLLSALTDKYPDMVATIEVIDYN